MVHFSASHVENKLSVDNTRSRSLHKFTEANVTLTENHVEIDQPFKPDVTYYSESLIKSKRVCGPHKVKVTTWIDAISQCILF